MQSTHLTAPSVDDAFWQYAALEGVFDEMYTTTGEMQPQWTFLTQALKNLGQAELKQRWQETRRLLRDNGVTYSVYDEERARPWELDLIPLLMADNKWQALEQGLIQRAHLFNLVLTDLYGPRELFKNNILPPEVIYAHPGFLHCCAGINNLYPLPFYAADLARTSTGNWYVVGDRTQAPPGAGYALENRMVLSRVFSNLFKEAHVRRLALFFRTLRNTLMNSAWRASDELRIVVLTPGPESETYFEHAYLAMYLGYTLVQGADLTVRDGQVCLKTLDGLQRVDVILRFVKDAWCDPLELRQDSTLGVAGLLQAVRMKQVSLVNPLGCGVLENPALMAFMSNIARYFLNEELKIPPAATWWCGQPRECNYVLTHLDELVIKQILPGSEPMRGGALSTAEKATLQAQILARPHLFIGQEEITCSTIPVLTPGQLEPRQMVLRSFLVATEESYMAMPGGLTRVSSSHDLPVLFDEAVSKDTWILSKEPEQAISLIPFMGQITALQHGQAELPSRVGENLFWLGRYTERAESIIRLLRVVLLHMLEPLDMTTNEQSQTCLHSLLRAVTHVTKTYPGFVGDEEAQHHLNNPIPELLSLFLDKSRLGSLASTLNALLYAVRSVRDRISPDIWRVFNTIEDGVQILKVHRNMAMAEETNTIDDLDSEILSATLEELDQLLISFAAFSGFVVEGMTHGQGWRFLMIGRRLERAQQTIPLLRTLLANQLDCEPILLEYLLIICDSIMTYRSRYRTQVQPQPTLELLLLDENNPRALAYQLQHLQTYVRQLPRADSVYAYKNQEQRLALEGLTRLRLASPEELLQTDDTQVFRTHLDQLLVRLSHILPALSDALTHSYFSHVEQPRQLVKFTGGHVL